MLIPSFTIRPATSSDATGILACLLAAFEPFRNSYTPQAFADTVLASDTLARRFKEMVIFAAADNSGCILGTIACSLAGTCEGHLRGMAVIPSMQGTGLAAQLLTSAESHFLENNCKLVSLDTTAPLERAIRFYLRFGFRPSGRVRDFFGMPLFEYVKTLMPRRLC